MLVIVKWLRNLLQFLSSLPSEHPPVLPLHRKEEVTHWPLSHWNSVELQPNRYSVCLTRLKWSMERATGKWTGQQLLCTVGSGGYFLFPVEHILLCCHWHTETAWSCKLRTYNSSYMWYKTKQVHSKKRLCCCDQKFVILVAWMNSWNVPRYFCKFTYTHVVSSVNEYL